MGDGNSSFGTLSLFVLNELVAPASVSSTITILTEVSAAPGFELAKPCDYIFEPAIVYNPQMGRDNVCTITDEVIGGTISKSDNSPARICIGEQVLSVRSLIKRFSRTCRKTPVVPNTYLSFYPWLVETGIFTSVPAFTASAVNFPDNFSCIAMCYALMRGGIRIKTLDLAPVTGAVQIAASFTPNTTTFGFTNNFIFTPALQGANDLPRNRPTTIFHTTGNGGAEAEYPYYNKYHSAPTAACIGASNGSGTQLTTDRDIAPNTVGYVNYPSIAGVSPTDPYILRAAAEDFSLGLFVSTPPVTAYSYLYNA